MTADPARTDSEGNTTRAAAWCPTGKPTRARPCATREIRAAGACSPCRGSTGRRRRRRSRQRRPARRFHAATRKGRRGSGTARGCERGVRGVTARSGPTATWTARSVRTTGRCARQPTSQRTAGRTVAREPTGTTHRAQHAGRTRNHLLPSVAARRRGRGVAACARPGWGWRAQRSRVATPGQPRSRRHSRRRRCGRGRLGRHGLCSCGRGCRDRRREQHAVSEPMAHHAPDRVRVHRGILWSWMTVERRPACGAIPPPINVPHPSSAGAARRHARSTGQVVL